MLLLFLVSGEPSVADDGTRARYVGGTLSSISEKAEGNLHVTDQEVLLFRSRKTDVRIPYETINLLEYGQRASRRLAMAVFVSPVFLLSKKREHFLTVGYSDEAGKQNALVFRVDKSKIRAVLASLEARTGRKVQFQDDEARRAGKG